MSRVGREISGAAAILADDVSDHVLAGLCRQVFGRYSIGTQGAAYDATLRNAFLKGALTQRFAFFLRNSQLECRYLH